LLEDILRHIEGETRENGGKWRKEGGKRGGGRETLEDPQVHV